ncbi:MAG: YqgE/AlgH family protein [Bryobacterales bacterium]|nr:YqgE/AlgH family protein [Bryobacterales bacterium]
MFWRSLLLALSLPAGLAAQNIPSLVPGKVLVAGRGLRDPNFAESVILLVRHSPKGSMGLVVNQPSRLRLSRLSEDLKGAANRQDRVYLGGPVSRSGAVALLRAAVVPAEAQHVFADVYLLSAKSMLEEQIAANSQPDKFRVYLGYAGWARGQLEAEIDEDAWHIFPGDAAWVFEGDPSTLWNRLIRRTELRSAELRPRAPAQVQSKRNATWIRTSIER